MVPNSIVMWLSNWRVRLREVHGPHMQMPKINYGP